LARVELLREGQALVDSGPLFATITVSQNGCPLSSAAIDGAQYALKLLEQLASFLPVIKKKALTLKPEDSYPQVVRKMISAAQAVNDPELTPLAAVAGATSDLVADHLLKTKATKIIVNNGGDIAIRLREEKEIWAGLCLNLTRRGIDYLLPVKSDCGICTSGIGGRSFTLGIASAVVILADRASVADAAATYLGNRTNVDSNKIKREWAEIIYPDTDIPGKKVTISVGALSEIEIQQALENGQGDALQLINSGVIRGAVLSVKNNILPLGVFKDKMSRSMMLREGDSFQSMQIEALNTIS
jgi:ApbE superfamily uncharacterized protein (UPF0280 family)